MRVVIVGSGAAGLTAASTVRKYDKEKEIIVITKERDIAYSPCAIPYVIEGTIKSFEDIIMHKPEDYKKRKNIDVLTETEVIDIDSRGNKVVLDNGEKIDYDYLVLSTGSTPFIPPIKGVNLDGVFTVKTIDDGRRILKYIEENNCKRAVIAGAGAIGLEMGYALKKRGLDVLIVEMAPQILPRFLDPDMAEIVQKYLESEGIRFILSKPLEMIIGDDKVKGVVVGGKEFDADIVILSTGVRPNIDLAKKAGCKVDKAIVVDEYMRTSIKNIYAAGDCVEVVDFITGEKTLSPFGSTAVRQGKVVGLNIVGKNVEFPPVLNSAVSKIGSLEIGGTGLTAFSANLKRIPIVIGKAKALTRARYYPGGKDIYVKLVFGEDMKILGCQIIGGERVAERIDLVSLAIYNGVKAEELCKMEHCYAPPVAMVNEPISLAAEEALNYFKNL
ncbi:pyridine nucleotide-disulfide oxidoreductase dimerization region [Methanocaldococcus villosus KIN24-T80]|uniref:Pyridine nucleotide-disulfide oxidoreductase dimerization region n=1 Tax=Methanocaldococcus villosus KIN24-T80 TaxID=1069083 RepID=N6VT72_9EURY|nr:FAD-dependent oxidoreductase [Methanocaldococcus villosus]ENN96396.1 pyridine nucleotide-disulfide oxidoreductase dimerization region [Methanocaldococcus villosus KIN24-T80]